MEGWAVNISLIQMPQEERGWTSRISEGSVAQAGALRQVFGSGGEWWGQERWLKQSEAENGLFLISIHLLMISFFIFAFFFQGHPLPFGGLVVFFSPPAFPHLPELPCSLQFGQFLHACFPLQCFSVSFLCLLFPSVFLPWYIFLLQLFSNTCSALLILNFTNGSFYSYHFSA